MDMFDEMNQMGGGPSGDAAIFDSADPYGLGEAQGYGEGYGEEVQQKEKNPFEEAEDRLKANQRVRRIGPAKEKDIRQNAKFFVKNMRNLHKKDIDAITGDPQSPAIYKAQSMDNVLKLIRREKMPINFVISEGLMVLTTWVKPLRKEEENSAGQLVQIPADQRDPPISVVKGVLQILQILGKNCTKDDLKKSKIGLEVKRLMQDRTLSMDLRVMAQSLITDWVADVTGTNKRRSEEEEDDDFRVNQQEEAMEVDERGRAVKNSALAPLKAIPDRRKTEQEMQRIWAPNDKQQAEYAERMKLRHAVMPMEKPIFDAAAAPLSAAPAKKRAKEDPNSGIGRIQTQLQRISNPNKKAWKSAVEQVSISGRAITQRY